MDCPASAGLFLLGNFKREVIMRAKIVKVTKTVDGESVHGFRVGEVVEISEIYEIPVNNGPGTEEYLICEAFCTGSDGLVQSVSFDDLEIISEEEKP